VLNGISLMFWFCLIDSIVSWQPYVIMAVNVAFLSLVAYANGWFYDTKPWYDRMKEEGET
jgi:hypothetical protein